MITRRGWSFCCYAYHCGVVIDDFNLKSDAVRAEEISIKYHKRDLTVTWVWLISRIEVPVCKTKSSQCQVVITK